MKRASGRQVFMGKSALLSELPAIGWDHFRNAGRNLAEHAHGGAWEFCYIERGAVDWWAENEIYEVGQGDIYVTRPAERHGGVDAMMHPCALFWALVVMPGRGAALPTLTVKQTAALTRDLNSIRHRTFPGSSSIINSFRRLHEAHQDPADPYATVLARAALHQLLIQIVRDHADYASRQRASDMTPGCIGRAINWMEKNLSEDFAIAEAANVAGLSVARFHKLFVEAVGLTPNAFRMRQRIGRAKHALRSSDVPVTSMGMVLGFSSSQYFATVFKSITGMTPQEYRRQARRGPAS